MVTATFSYLIVRTFTPNSVYHIQLARRKELLTHDKDTNVLRMLEVRKLIEKETIATFFQLSIRMGRWLAC